VVGGLLRIQPHDWITLIAADERQTPEQAAYGAAGLTIGGCFRYASPTPLAPATRLVGGGSLSPGSSLSPLSALRGVTHDDGHCVPAYVDYADRALRQLKRGDRS